MWSPLRSFARLLPASCVLAAVLASGCGDSPRLFVDLRWQIKCDGNPGCQQQDHPQHDFFSYSGDFAELPTDNPRRFTARCSLEELSSGDLLWNFSAETSTYSFEVRNAQIPAGGGAVTGTGCTVIVVDDVNTYEGACGNDAPSVDQPCRFTAVGLSNSEIITGLPGRTLSTTVECDGIRNQILLTDERNLRSLDSGSPAPLNIVNCDGFPF